MSLREKRKQQKLEATQVAMRKGALDKLSKHSKYVLSSIQMTSSARTTDRVDVMMGLVQEDDDVTGSRCPPRRATPPQPCSPQFSGPSVRPAAAGFPL